MMRVLRVRRLMTRACAVPSRPSKHGGRDHLNVSRQEQHASPNKTLSGDPSLVIIEIIPCVYRWKEGRCLHPRLRRTLCLSRFLFRQHCVNPKNRRTTGTTISRRAYRSPSYKVIVRLYIFFRLITLNHLYSALESRPLRRSNHQSTTMMHKRSGRAAPGAKLGRSFKTTGT